MKFNLFLFVLVTQYYVSPSLADVVVSKTLDKGRVARLFTTDQRASGHTYLDTVKLESIVKMDFGGIGMDTITHTTIESEVVISNDPDAVNGYDNDNQYRYLDTKMIRFMYEMESIGGTFSCDTQNGLENEPVPDMCSLFYQNLGQVSHYVTDEHGIIIEASGPNSELVKALSETVHQSQPQSLEDNNVVDVVTTEDDSGSSSATTDPFNTRKHIEQQSRILGLIKSDVAVQPGDTWDSSMDMGDMGHYDGTGTLLGYRSVDGVDCAVFSNVGSLHIDYETLIKTMFGDNNMFGELLKDITISDATMTTLLYYEYETNLVRWSKTSQSFVMEMPDPMDDSKKMSIPMEQNIVTTSIIKPE